MVSHSNSSMRWTVHSQKSVYWVDSTRPPQNDNICPASEFIYFVPLSTWKFGRPSSSVEAWMTRCVLCNIIKSKYIFHDDFKDRCLKNGWLRLISDIKSCVEYFLKDINNIISYIELWFIIHINSILNLA